MRFQLLAAAVGHCDYAQPFEPDTRRPASREAASRARFVLCQGPGDGNWKLHTGIFVFYLSASYLACLGNYLESKNGKYRLAPPPLHLS